MEVERWYGIDPLPKPPLFQATAEKPFGCKIFIFGEPAIPWQEGWRVVSFHPGIDDVHTPDDFVLAKFGSFLDKLYGENREAMVLPESDHVLLSDL